LTPPPEPHGGGGKQDPTAASGFTVHVNGLDRWSEVEVTERDVERAALAAMGSSPEVIQGELSISFIDDQEISRLNAQWLDRGDTTDVISFSLGTSAAVLGDIYISVDTARANAEALEIDPSQEMLRLVIHGTLHVLGHDHPEGEGRESTEMYRLQEELLQSLGNG
jgi:probable rRNA maturation factor